MAFAVKFGAPSVPRSSKLRNARIAGVRPVRVAPMSKRYIRQAAAIEEQETTFQQPQEEEATLTAPPELEDPTLAHELKLQELDSAQEDLLKWMLYLDEEAQEADLEEMVEYDELGDEEYEELWDTVDDMLDKPGYDLRVGSKVVGTVYECDEDGAYIEVGAKTAGFVPLSECSLAKLKSPLEVLRPGMRREFVVVEEEDEYGEIILSLSAMEAQAFWERIRQLQEEDMAVTVTVAAVNRGGLVVQYHHLEGFIPVSHFGPSITLESMEGMIGYQLPAKFLEVDEERERLVLSHRRASSDSGMAGFEIGDVVVGVVQSVKPYGAFIDIGGGATGLLHISQISHERLTQVEQVLAEGDKLKVMILSQDKERGRVTLSTKKLEPSPGDMLKDPQLVFEKAEEMAAQFKERVEAADAQYMERLDSDSAYGGAVYGGAPMGMAPPPAPLPETEEQFAFDA